MKNDTHTTPCDTCAHYSADGICTNDLVSESDLATTPNGQICYCARRHPAVLLCYECPARICDSNGAVYSCGYARNGKLGLDMVVRALQLADCPCYRRPTDSDKDADLPPEVSQDK